MQKPEGLSKESEYCRVGANWEYVHIAANGLLYGKKEVLEYRTDESIEVTATDNGIILSAKNGEVTEVALNTYSVQSFVEEHLVEKHDSYTLIAPKDMDMDDYRKLLQKSGHTDLLPAEKKVPF